MREGSFTEGGRLSPIDILHLAPDGPLTTLTRNISMCSAVLLGVVAVVFPALQGAEFSSVVLFAVAGLVLIAAAAWSALRWKRLVQSAAHDVQDAGALTGFAFARAELDVDGAPRDHINAGWLLVHKDRLTVCVGTGPAISRLSVVRQDHPLREIVSVSRRNETSMSYGRLDITLHGRLLSFQLTPTNGSGLRGPSETEIDSAVTTIRSARGLDA